MNKDMNLIMENWRVFLTEEEKEKKIEFLLEKLTSSDESMPLTEEEIVFLLEEGALDRIEKPLAKIWNTTLGFIKKLAGIPMKASNLANIILELSKDVESVEYRSSGSFKKTRDLLRNTLQKIEGSKLTQIPLEKLRVFNKISRGVRFIQTILYGWAVPKAELEKAKELTINSIRKGAGLINLKEEEELDKEEKIKSVSEFFDKYKSLITAQEEIDELTSNLKTFEESLNKMMETSKQDDKSVYDFLRGLYNQMGSTGKGSSDARNEAVNVLRDFLDIYNKADAINDRFKEIGSLGKVIAAAVKLTALAMGGSVAVPFIVSAVMGGASAATIASVATSLKSVKAVKQLFVGAAGMAAEKANKEELDQAIKAAEELEAEFK